MTFYDDGKIQIRSMENTDIEDLSAAFKNQNWDGRKEILAQYFLEQESDKRTVLVASYEGAAAGYLTLLPETSTGPFAHQKIPEIKDFNVFIPYRNKGIGTKLMDCIESIAKQHFSSISLAVGLYPDYGTAQIMYVKRGYIPDGSGIWYNEKQLKQHEPCINDDNLNLYFWKHFA